MPRGYLGVGIQPVRLSSELQSQLNQETGLMIMSVENDGPATKAGILQGDILVTLDNSPIRHVDDLQSLLGSDRIGKSVPARLVRSGQLQQVAVTIGQHG